MLNVASRTSNRFFAQLEACQLIAGPITKIPNTCGNYKFASSTFLLDYQAHPERYVSGALPKLPFADDSFDMTLVSYFLFAYQDRLSCEFHRDSILEIMRVTRGEARIYPTVTFEAEPSHYLPLLKSDPALCDFEFTVIKTNFEFLLNSNSFLRVRRL